MIYLLFASLVCLALTWSVGANDLANVMSPTMGSRAVAIRTAIILAIIFELAGALLGGHDVLNTIRVGIIDTSALSPTELKIGMLSILLAGSSWMLFASYLGMPVSVTNSIVGALVGFGMIVLGASAIKWHHVGWIATSWVSSPLIASIAAYILMRSIQRNIFGSKQPILRAKQCLPIYLFLAGMVLSHMIILNTLEHTGLFDPKAMSHFSYWSIRVVIYAVSSLSFMAFGLLALRQFYLRPAEGDSHEQFGRIESQFSFLVVLTTCAMIFAHGSNDIPITVGPLSVVLDKTYGLTNLMRWSVFVFGCVGVLLGLIMYGHKVIATVGKKITDLTPSRAFSATLAASATVIISTDAGIPVSATQTLVGAVLGVGLARGIGALNLSVIRNIFFSWVITLPVSSFLAMVYYNILRATLM